MNKILITSKAGDNMTEKERADIKGENSYDKELVTFIKETRKKTLLHEYLTIAAKSYIDGIQTALRCQQAAQASH